MRLALPAGAFNRAMIGAIAVLVGVSFVVAVIAPPNNYDSMTYHMSRVAHWAHNRGVKHVEVKNLSARLPQESGDPGAIFVLKLDQGQWGFLVKEQPAASGGR